MFLHSYFVAKENHHKREVAAVVSALVAAVVAAGAKEAAERREAELNDLLDRNEVGRETGSTLTAFRV